MYKVSAALLALLFSSLSFSQSKEEELRTYSDSLAQLIVEKNEDAVFEQFASVLRSSYPRAELIDPLPLIGRKYGDILSLEYRQKIQGQTSFSGQRVSHMTYWYAVETANKVPRAFLLLKITLEKGRPCLVGIDFRQIVGPIPEFLEARKK